MVEIILTEGCVCDSLIIDGKEARDYSGKELNAIIKQVLEEEKSKFNLIRLLGMVVEIFDDGSTDDCAVKTDKYGLITITEQDQDGVDVITVGERDANDFTVDKIRDMIIAVINSRGDNADLIWTLQGLVQNLGEYKFCYHCDECGDNVVEYKLKLSSIF